MPTFTATRLQVATYLLGVCPFSIAFLVFLNSSISFVITDLIGLEKNVGNAVGNLGFADELVALLACPFWGLLSDRIGVRYVCVLGYATICLALLLFVQAHNVYPQLLLGRLLFSIGGAAASTMVTAILPTMTYSEGPRAIDPSSGNDSFTTVQRPGAEGQEPCPSVNSELTITPTRFQPAQQSNVPHMESNAAVQDQYRSTSRIAGFVGMFTGCGALIALLSFLPLPARFQKSGVDPADALKYSYYLVASVAFILVFWCAFGLRNLQYDYRKEAQLKSTEERTSSLREGAFSAWQSFKAAFMAGFQNSDIAMGYLGGFVARASSVGISLFIPLLVNALFLSSGFCDLEKTFGEPVSLPDIRRKCPRAYVVAAELTGVSQMTALISAPIFGYFSARTSRRGLPLTIASAAGIIGYPVFAKYFDPDDSNSQSRGIAFLAVCLIGISQIGAIVCSLGILSSGVLAQTSGKQEKAVNGENRANGGVNEVTALLGETSDRNPYEKAAAPLKGSVAGVYSLYGGLAILILTKIGGLMFDKVSVGSPFYIMAGFNAILMLACFALGLSTNRNHATNNDSRGPEN